MENKIVKSLEKINEIIDKNEALKFESINIIDNNSFYDVDSIKNELNRLENSKRKVKIGIVGKVKAGKSTLLNSLFFDHKDILPKAATPMTAALTEISYGEKLKFEVNYFTKEELEIIKESSNRYEKIFNEEFEFQKKKKQEELKKRNKEYNLKLDEELKKKIKKEINSKWNFLVASYEQYEKIKNSNKSIDYFDQNLEIEVLDYEDLKNKISDFVGSKGEYMPFTKSIKIYLNFPELEKYDIVDTPGLNDPIISRSQRTKDLLKECDVIFVVSQSGEFLTDEDINLIENLKLKNGISKIYCIASKVDDQLFGSEYSGKDFKLNLNNIETKLREHAQKVLKNSDIILSSGMAENIFYDFNRKDIEGSEEKHLFDNLVRLYPDYFKNSNEELSKNNLGKISNIEYIKEKLRIVGDEKEKIILEKTEKFLENIENNFYKYKELLLSSIKEKIDKINSIDKDELEIKIKKLKSDKNKISSSFIITYSDLIEEIALKIRKELTKIIDEENEIIKAAIGSSKSVRTESYQVKSSGFVAMAKRFFGAGGYETINERVEYLNTTEINYEVSLLKNKVENKMETLYSEILLKWKKNLSEVIVRTLMENLSIDVIDDNEIKLSIRRAVEKLKLPKIEFNNNPNKILEINSNISGSMKEMYINELYRYLENFSNVYYSNIQKVNDEINKLKNMNPLEKIFNDFDNKLNSLILDLENKESSIRLYEGIYKEIEEVK